MWSSGSTPERMLQLLSRAPPVVTYVSSHQVGRCPLTRRVQKITRKKIGQKYTARIHSWQTCETRLSHENLASLRMASLAAPSMAARLAAQELCCCRSRATWFSVGRLDEAPLVQACACGSCGKAAGTPWCASLLTSRATQVLSDPQPVCMACAIDAQFCLLFACGDGHAPHRLHSSPHARTGTCYVLCM